MPQLCLHRPDQSQFVNVSYSYIKPPTLVRHLNPEERGNKLRRNIVNVYHFSTVRHPSQYNKFSHIVAIILGRLKVQFYQVAGPTPRIVPKWFSLPHHLALLSSLQLYIMATSAENYGGRAVNYPQPTSRPVN